jgi:hypothetical protein
VTDGANLKNRVPFTCTWKSASGSHDSLSGICQDQQHSWTVSLSEAPSAIAGRSYNIPRVDLSALTTAEKAAFSQVLSKEPCRCGMTVLTCLRKHPACQYKEPLAQTALAAFLQTARR